MTVSFSKHFPPGSVLQQQKGGGCGPGGFYPGVASYQLANDQCSSEPVKTTRCVCSTEDINVANI